MELAKLSKQCPLLLGCFLFLSLFSYETRGGDFTTLVPPGYLEPHKVFELQDIRFVQIGLEALKSNGYDDSIYDLVFIHPFKDVVLVSFAKRLNNQLPHTTQKIKSIDIMINRKTHKVLSIEYSRIR